MAFALITRDVHGAGQQPGAGTHSRSRLHDVSSCTEADAGRGAAGGSAAVFEALVAITVPLTALPVVVGLLALVASEAAGGGGSSSGTFAQAMTAMAIAKTALAGRLVGRWVIVDGTLTGTGTAPRPGRGSAMASVEPHPSTRAARAPAGCSLPDHRQARSAALV
jgi:hypothetical protein